ncbi:MULTISPECIES: transcriptional regulator [Paraburkholderia]|uniref:transcriptional regulator n=1 Tax=Paraburkholderia TaxID=1822464 RepID=UPI00035E8B11|nr:MULTISPECIES: transcriptional regulator [Paraburkholderia]MDH6146091.1 transcriptional regulator with XRE-family HTH domain [Paraburkholderia sp. WSM4179]
MKSTKYLDELATRKNLHSDADLARYLGCSKGAISNYRHGNRVMENDLCLRIALELDMDNPLPVIMAADMDRAEKAGQQSLWEIFLPRMAGISAALVLGVVTNFVTPSPAQAAPLLQNGVAANYIMSNYGFAPSR